VLEVAAGFRYSRTGKGTYVISPGARENYDQLLADIARYERMPGKILHLWPVMGENGDQPLEEILDLGFYSLLFLAQALGDQDAESVEITSVSNGLQSVSGEKVVAPARAAGLGAMRVIPREFSRTFCRHLDLDWKIEDLGKAAEEVVAECAAAVAECCIVRRQSERWVESFEAKDLRGSSASRLKERGVYWITGGLGGIGLVIAEHLARTVKARLVLSGRTALPPRSEWDALLAQPKKTDAVQQKIRSIRELESLGSEVLTIAADVTSRKQMEEALTTIRQRFAALDGVIHAAGLIEDGPLQIKTRESAARVLAPKIQGTLVLQEVLRSSKLDFWILFSSISSLAPPAGQVDYAGANAFLDAFALTQTGHPTTALNWGLWTEVGMASRGRTDHPILGRRLFQSASEALYSVRLSCEKDWLLDEHRFKSGAALVPGTGYLQLAAAALVEDRFEPGVMFEDVFFLAPLSVNPGETRDVRVRLRRQRSGFRFSILAKDKGWTEYASGQVERNQKRPPADQDISELYRRCGLRRIDFDDQRRTRQERYFDFGRRWHNLQALHIGEREAVAELRLGQEFSADFEIWPMHPALLDLATGSSLYLIKGYEDADVLYLPLSYKRIRFYRPLGCEVYGHIRCHQDNTAQREIVTFDITLLDAEGRVIAEIEEFSLRRLVARTDHAAPVIRPAVATVRQLDVEMAEQGISSADGMKAFDQILCSEMRPNLIVVRGGLVADRSEEFPAATPAKVEAKTEGGVEGVLAEWWRELLGVETVGPDDDFFDLGGHSLVAVRLFSKIKKTFRVDLGLSTLFEARTVRQLATLIRQAGTSSAGEEVASPAVVPVRQQGSRLPIFLISGVGGEVIGFQTLARCLGDDQPVFALQPQGLDGRKPFLTRVEDMAAYYLREIRDVQPHGPYCLAGYSFGGYVVFEMAQQLHAAGETVALLGFLDTIEWQYLERVRQSADFTRRWALRLDRFKDRRWEYVKETLVDQSSAKVKSMVYRLFDRFGRQVPQSVSKLEDINRFAMSIYRPTVYPGRLTIFRSVTRTAAVDNDELLGWGKLVSGGIEVQDVPGRHRDILIEPNVRILAEKMRTCLDRVQALPPHDATSETDRTKSASYAFQEW
jgi:thioesterase domain-containing protein/NADP-dependent 3-hydroxy acid dehydrogenase YdfG/acyl carrier protein